MIPDTYDFSYPKAIFGNRRNWLRFRRLCADFNLWFAGVRP